MKNLLNYSLKLFYVIIMPIVTTVMCYSIVLNHSINTFELISIVLFLISSFLASVVLNNKIKSVKLLPDIKFEFAFSISFGILFHDGEIIILFPFILVRIKPRSRRSDTSYYR